MRRSRNVRLAAAVAGVSLLGLSACGGEDEAPDENASVAEADDAAAETVEDDAAEDAAADDTEDDTEDEASGDSGDAGNQASWAAPVNTDGEQVATFEVGDVTVDVLQVGTAEAPKQGNWVDPETDEPLIAEGDELVFVRYVMTNNGDAVDLGSSLVNISSAYEDWEYMQGMGGITDSALAEEMGIETSPIEERQDPAIYTFGPGESYSYGENFHYQPGTELNVGATVTPVDEEGELIHDERIEGEGSGTIN